MMPYNAKYCYIIFLLGIVLVSCSDEPGKKEVPPVKTRVPVEWIPLEKQLFELGSPEETSSFLLAQPAFTQLYLDQHDSIPDAKLVNYIYDFYQNPALKEFYQYTDSSFGDRAQQKADFSDLFSRIKEHYPEFNPPKVYTVVTGFRFDKDIALSDSAIVISIDYFLGNTAPHRPNHYAYFLKRYDKPYLLPMIGLAMSTKYNKVNLSDKTMLANMIYYGKAHYFLEQVMPAIPDSLNIMYTEAELKTAHKMLPVIWGHFIEKQLLYETGHKALEHYVGEAPFTNAINQECPGRIGRWLGWLIVKEYMKKNPSLSLKELMEEDNAEKIFKNSGFRPEK